MAICMKTVEKLYKGGLVNEKNFKALAKKYSDGGIEDGILPSEEKKLSTGIAALDQAINDPAVLAAQQLRQRQEQEQQAQADYQENVDKQDIYDRTYKYKDVTEAKNQLMQSAQARKEQQQEAYAKGNEVAVVPASDSMQVEPQEQKPQNAGALFDKSMSALGFDEQSMARSAASGANLGAEAAAAQKSYELQMNKERENQAKVEQLRRERMEKSANELNDALIDFKKTSAIDPNRFTANLSTGQKIVAAIGIALSGKGGLDILQSAINRDIEAQKANQQNKADAIKGQQTMYSLMLQRFGDERAADAATRMGLLQDAEMKLKALGVKAQGIQMQQNAQNALAQIDLEKKKLAVTFATAVQNSKNFQTDDKVYNDILNKVPQHLQSDAMKEYNTYKQTQSDLNQVKAIFKEMNSISMTDRAAGKIPFKSDKMQPLISKMTPLIKNVLKEALNEADVKRLLDPFVRQGLDTDKDMQTKERQFDEMISSRIAGQTQIIAPYLRAAGVGGFGARKYDEQAPTRR